MERLVPLTKNLDDPRCIRVGHSITRLAILLALVVVELVVLFVGRFIDQTT